MNIQNKINEIAEYFKKKVIDGDYELQEMFTETTIKIIIDEKYIFKVYEINTYLHIVNEIVGFTIDLHLTRPQSEEAHIKFAPKYEIFKKTVLKNRKKMELEKLQKELNEL